MRMNPINNRLLTSCLLISSTVFLAYIYFVVALGDIFKRLQNNTEGIDQLNTPPTHPQNEVKTMALWPLN